MKRHSKVFFTQIDPAQVEKITSIVKETWLNYINPTYKKYLGWLVYGIFSDWVNEGALMKVCITHLMQD